MTRIPSQIVPFYGSYAQATQQQQPQTIQQPVQGAPTRVATTQSAPGVTNPGTGSAGGQVNPTNFNPNPLPAATPYQPVGPGNPAGQQALDQMAQSQQDARQANEQRYQQILGGAAPTTSYNQLLDQTTRELSGIPQEYRDIAQGYADREQQLGGMLEGYGQSAQDALERKRTQNMAGLDQNLINRGLYNSSAALTGQRGIESQYAQDLGQLNDILTRQKMDYLGALSKDTLNSRALAPQAQMDVTRAMNQQAQQGLGFAERREDVGPSLQDAAALGGAMGIGNTAVPDYQSVIQNTGQQVAIPGTPQTPGTTPSSPTQTTGGGGGTGQVPGSPTQTNPTNVNLPTSTGNRLSARGGTGSRGGGGGGGGGGGDTFLGQSDAYKEMLRRHQERSGSRTTGGTSPQTGESVVGGLPGGQTPTTTPTTGGGSTGEGPLQPIPDPNIQGPSTTQPPMGEGEQSVLKTPDGQTQPSPTQQPSGFPEMDQGKYQQLYNPEYVGTGVYVPGFPYPVNMAGLTPEQLKSASPWPGSQTSAAALAKAQK